MPKASSHAIAGHIAVQGCRNEPSALPGSQQHQTQRQWVLGPEANCSVKSTHTHTHVSTSDEAAESYLKLVRTLMSKAELSPCTGCRCITGPSTREIRGGMGKCNALTASFTSCVEAKPLWSAEELRRAVCIGNNKKL